MYELTGIRRSPPMFRIYLRPLATNDDGLRYLQDQGHHFGFVTAAVAGRFCFAGAALLQLQFPPCYSGPSDTLWRVFLSRARNSQMAPWLRTLRSAMK
jgi:hypothetical protein